MKTKENKTKLLFDKVVNEISSFCFNTTNLIDDLSIDETEEEKEMVEKQIINMLSNTRTQECKEQIQQDLITYLEGMDSEILDNICKIVVDNFNKK